MWCIPKSGFSDVLITLVQKSLFTVKQKSDYTENLSAASENKSQVYPLFSGVQALVICDLDHPQTLSRYLCSPSGSSNTHPSISSFKGIILE